MKFKPSNPERNTEPWMLFCVLFSICMVRTSSTLAITLWSFSLVTIAKRSLSMVRSIPMMDRPYLSIQTFKLSPSLENSYMNTSISPSFISSGISSKSRFWAEYQSHFARNSFVRGKFSIPGT